MVGRTASKGPAILAIDLGACFCRVAEVVPGEDFSEKPVLKVPSGKATVVTEDISNYGGVFGEYPPFSQGKNCANVFHLMKIEAEKAWARSFTGAVLSVPYSLNDDQRKTVRKCAMLAGLNPKELVNGPTAAAVAYKELDGVSDENAVFLVMGERAFDVAAISLAGGVKVKAVSGSSVLGGGDFTDVLVAHCLDKLEKTSSTEESELLIIKKRLRWLCDRAKKKLSSYPKVFIEADLLKPGLDFTIEISREVLEHKSKALISIVEKSLSEARSCLTSSRMSNQRVVIVGGSTNMPWVYKSICRLFGPAVTICSVPSAYIIQGTLIMANETNNLHRSFSDILPYSIEVRSHPNQEHMEIPRYTTLPAYFIQRVELSKKQFIVRFNVQENSSPYPCRVLATKVTHKGKKGTGQRAVSVALRVSEDRVITLSPLRSRNISFESIL